MSFNVLGMDNYEKLQGWRLFYGPTFLNCTFRTKCNYYIKHVQTVNFEENIRRT